MQWRQGAILAAFAAGVFLVGLGGTHFWDDDEAYFAEVAREMHERDDLIVPWFNHQLFAHKPPFMYWMMIGGFRLLGVSELAARLPSALFGVACVLLVWRLGRMLYSPRAGLWAGVILASCLNFAVISRAAASDAELTFFCTLALYLFVRGTAVRRPAAEGGGASQWVWHAGQTFVRPGWGTCALAYAAMGMAVLVKGPIGVLLPTAVLGVFSLWLRAQEADASPAEGSTAPSGRWRVLAFLGRMLSPAAALRTAWSLRPLTALAAVLLVAGPWYLAVGWQTGGAFLEGFFGVHHFGRFVSPMDNHAGPVWFYLAAVCVGFFPWIVFLGPTAGDWWRRIRDRHAWRLGDMLCGAWCLVWFGFFSLASTKFPHYVVPAYPALALITGAFLDRWISEAAAYRPLLRRTAWGTIGLAGVGILVAVPLLQQALFGETGLAGLCGLPLVAGAALGAPLAERGRAAAALRCLAATAGVFAIALLAFAAREIDRRQNSPALARTIRAHAGSARPVIAAFHHFRPSLVYYCGEPIQRLATPEEAAAFVAGGADRYLLTSGHEYEQLVPALPPEVRVLERQPWFMRRGKDVVLLRGGQAGEDRRPAATAERDAAPVPR